MAAGIISFWKNQSFWTVALLLKTEYFRLIYALLSVLDGYQRLVGASDRIGSQSSLQLSFPFYRSLGQSGTGFVNAIVNTIFVNTSRAPNPHLTHPVCFVNTIVNTRRMSDPHPIHQILSAYQNLNDQYEKTLDREMDLLYEQVTNLTTNLRRQEYLWLAARSNWVKKLRPLLEADARCLLTTPEFRSYVQPLLFLNPAGVPLTQRLAANPSAWVLAQIEHPLHLEDYLAVYHDNTYGYCLTARLQSWQQQFRLPVAALHYDFSEFFGAKEQWAETLKQIQPDFGNLRLAEAQESLLCHEISCLICYIGQLFELRPKSAWFRYP